VAHTPISVGLALRLLTVGRRSILHVHTAQAFIPETVLVTSFLRRRPYIAHFHLDVDPSGPLGVLLAGYKRWILGPFLRRAAAVVALSSQQADFLTCRYGVEPERITVIPNGVHPRFFKARDRRPVQAAPARKLRLLFVGRLDEQKNVLRLVNAMAHVTSDAELSIVGDGELRDEISRRIDVLGLTGVNLAGAARGNELVQWYCWADAFVLSSDKEGMPLVLLEAMAAGLAIVAADAPGTREIVDGVGLLARPDPESLAAAIDRLATDPALLTTLSARSANRGMNFDWRSSVSSLERLYDSVAVT